MGAEQDRYGTGRGLQQVVPAEGDQRGADEGHVRGGVHGREFAHGVQDDYIEMDGIPRVLAGSVGVLESRPPQHLLYLRYAVEMPRRPDQPYLGMPFVDAGEGRQDGSFLFHGPGASRHDHRYGRGEAEFTAQRFSPGARLFGGQVEFYVARHPHPFRVRAISDEPFTVERMLDTHGGQAPQHVPEQRSHETVPRETAVRHAAVDQGYGAVVGGGRLEHTGPEFPLEQNQCAGAYPSEYAADDERRVEGRQPVIPCLPYMLPDIGKAGLGRGGHQHGETGMTLHEAANHGRQAGGLAPGGAVEPDDRAILVIVD